MVAFLHKHDDAKKKKKVWVMGAILGTKQSSLKWPLVSGLSDAENAVSIP